MKKLILILCLFSMCGIAVAVTDTTAKPMSVANEDEDKTMDLNTSNHDVQSDEDENAFTPPSAEDAENGRLSENQSFLKDDDYN